MAKRRTFVIDLDGTMIKHRGERDAAWSQWQEFELLPHAVRLLNELQSEGAFVVLLTGRKESCRSWLVEALSNRGVFYDVLVMGAGDGERVIVNDHGARGISVTTNQEWKLDEDSNLRT
jgi:hydroxymethylpyrimidine pyrophosphatase-like HAD family hydrolase